MAVPDWPLSFGSINPEGWWHIPSVRLEHGHRLVGMLIGLLVTVAMVWTLSRLRSSAALCWLSVSAFLAVGLQGYLGGKRVVDVSTELAIAHGIFGQAVFCLLVVTACVFDPRWSRERTSPGPAAHPPTLLAGSLLALIFVQLMVAATLRHYNVGLAIPDFPLSNGRIIPEFTSWAVGVNFTHRVLAFVILGVALALVARVFPSSGKRADPFVQRAIGLVLLLIFTQICLGVFTIWSVGAPVPTTLHVSNGALVIATSAALFTRCVWLLALARQPAPAAESSRVPIPQHT